MERKLGNREEGEGMEIDDGDEDEGIERKREEMIRKMRGCEGMERKMGE